VCPGAAAGVLVMRLVLLAGLAVAAGQPPGACSRALTGVRAALARR
jgi:hypothetical protein